MLVVPFVCFLLFLLDSRASVLQKHTIYFHYKRPLALLKRGDVYWFSWQTHNPHSNKPQQAPVVFLVKSLL